MSQKESVRRTSFCSMIFITIIMKLAGKKPVLFWQRTLLVVGALLCLCVSDSAGPRLLPLPGNSSTFAVSVFPVGNCSSASQAPGPERESTYNKMVAGSHYRARERHNDVRSSTPAVQTFVQLPPANLASSPAIYAPFNFKSPSLLHSIGRAPPLA